MTLSIRAIALSFAFLAPLSVLASGQEAVDETALVQGQLVSGTLDAGASDSYVIDAEADQFVSGAADQVSVDVVVKVFGPDGKLIDEFDRPAVGPEHFIFETEVAGRYRIEVVGFEEDSGSYSITLQTLEPVAKTGPGRVDQLMARFSGTSTPGGVIIVVEKGKTVFEKAYGMANLEHDAPFKIETPSNLGSTSKQFTAFAISLLDAEGALSIDDDVRKHIPELPDFGEVVTLRHLLTHTSGYREFLNTLSMTGRRLDEGDFIDRKELIEIVQRQPALQNSPGSEFNYNNTGYGLLTVVLERVTGNKFPEWMESNVFAKLGMSSTSVRANPSQIIRGRSQGYTVGPNGFQDSRDLGGALGAGAIYTTVGDMAKWMRNLQTGAYGGEEIIAAMSTSFELTTGKPTGYGFGLMIDEQKSLKRIHHGGADSAHRAQLIVYPSIEGGVVALSNNAVFDAGGIAAKIGQAFFGEHMQLEEELATDIASAEGSADAFDPASFKASDFEPLAGRYELEEMPGFILAFKNEDGVFVTQATGQQETTITPTSALTFKIDGVDAEIVFHQEADGTVKSLILNQNGSHQAKRVTDEPWAPSAEQLAAYAGRYFSEELETFYTIVIEDGNLLMRHRRLEELKLSANKEHLFGTPIGAKFKFAVTDTGDVTGFDLSNGRTRGIRFERLPWPRQHGC